MRVVGRCPKGRRPPSFGGFYEVSFSKRVFFREGIYIPAWLFLIFFLPFFLTAECQGGCVVTKKTCIDPGATKTINGIPVTRDCWGYEEEKTCFVLDTGVNGCSTLEADVKEKGEGGCYLKSQRCTDAVTDVDGKETCLTTESVYSCEKEIALPALNAAFRGEVTETQISEDATDCDAIAKMTACTLLSKEEAADGNLIRTYACSEEDVAACTALAKSGCARIKAPACDAATDASCALKVGRMRCTTLAFEDYVERGDATLVSQVKRAATRGVKDTSVEASLENDTTTCEVVTSTCTDSAAGYRVVNGARVYASCWAYEETLRCRDTSKTSTCDAVEKTRTCTLTETTYEEVAADGACRKEVRRYVCNAAADDIFEEGAVLEKEDTEVLDTVEISNCGEIEIDSSCKKEKEECLLTDDVTGSCKEKLLTFSCGSAAATEKTLTDDCTALSQATNCRLVAEECSGRDADGTCTMKTLQYVCGGETEEVEVGEVCDETLCVGGICEEVESVNNTDAFLQSAALLEIAREAGVYSDMEKGEIFKGLHSTCSVKAAGPSCCRRENASAAASLGNRGFQIALTAGVGASVEAIKYVGSPYVYDLLSSHESLEGLLTSLYGKNGTGVYKPSFSFYGVSVTADAAGSLTMNFSPSAFFFAVAMEFVMDYMRCDAADQLHVMREAAGLCHYVGSFCAKKSGLGCLVKKESWVCFNSKLARLVQEAARLQLGLGWGSPESPMTRGLTTEEFKSVDFSKIDLTGIISEVARESATKLVSPTNNEATTTRAKERVTDVTSQEGSLQYEEAFDSITGKCRAADGTLTDCVTR